MTGFAGLARLRVASFLVAACVAGLVAAAPVLVQHAKAGSPAAESSKPSKKQKAALYPRFKKGTPYKAARATLLSSGWSPVPPTGESPCEPGDTSCEEMPELQSCAGTGEGNCLFLWRRNETVVAIFSVSDPPVIARVECRSRCR